MLIHLAYKPVQLLRDKLAFVIRIVSNVVFGVLFGCIFFQVGESDYETSALR
jgi:hypothetical protein